MTLVISSELISIFIYNYSYKAKDPMLINSWGIFHSFNYQRKPLSFRDILLKNHSKEIKSKFNSTFITTSTGKRFTPSSHDKVDKDIVFFGCSYTYGTGVNNNETVPYFVQTLIPNSKTHNLAIPGYGPNEALESVLNIDKLLKYDLPLKNPIGIYVYFDDHINRSSFNLSHIFWRDLLSLKSFEIDKYNNIKVLSFRNKHPFKYFFYSLLKFSRLARIFYLELADDSDNTQKFSKKDINHAFIILKLTQEKFLKRFPDGQFFVFSLDSSERANYLEMRENKLNILNTDDTGFDGPRLPDGHFNHESNLMIAQKILKYLREKEAL